MLTGRRFVIGGLSRLTARVARALRDRNADVVVVGDAERDGDTRQVVDLLGDDVVVIDPGTDRDRALHDAGLAGAAGFLALDENDLENLRFVADAHELAPEVPCVLRTFQPELADAVARELNIRRSFSVAALAAPTIVAAAMGEEVIETLRIADEEVPLCIVDVHGSSVMAGATPEAVKAGTECAVIAVRRSGGAWSAAPSGEDALGEGDQALVGGRIQDVLALAVGNATRKRGGRRRRSVPPGRRRTPIMHATLLRVSALLFMAVFVLATVVNLAFVGNDLNDAMTGALSTAFGNMPAANPNEWLQWFNFAVLIAAVVLFWILVSHLTALVLAERLELRMSRRARKAHDHVVVVGLGKVGYRVVQLLAELGVPTVAIER